METVIVGDEEESNLETQLLYRRSLDREGRGRGCCEFWFRGEREEVVEEAKRQIWLAGPLIGVSLLQYSLQVIAIMFVGHLGNLPLSGASLGSSFANVTGFSVLLGMGSALETLCGQAYGAKQYQMLGIHTQRAILVLLSLSIPLSLILYNTSIILTTLGQHRDISAEAGTFNRWMIPGVFAYGILQCLNSFEYWSFEMVVLLSGLLPNPQLETSVLSISLNTCWMVYMISVGLGGAISTRVANELGSGNSNGAVLAVRVMMTMVICEGSTVAILTILVRNVWGRLYSNDPKVIHYVASMMPLLALSDFLDGFQCVLSGAARGCGWQNLCAIINLGAYYVVGIPSALLFSFLLHIGGMGLWMGIICGLTVQSIALVTVNACTDWTQEARKAADLTQKTSIVVEP